MVIYAGHLRVFYRRRGRRRLVDAPGFDVANQPRRRQTDAIDELRQLRYGDNNYFRGVPHRYRRHFVPDTAFCWPFVVIMLQPERE
jgi:hypothetical protein